MVTRKPSASAWTRAPAATSLSSATSRWSIRPPTTCTSPWVMVAATAQVPVLHLDARTQPLQARHVHVEPARADGVAPRERHARLAAPGKERAQHRDRGPHPAYQVVVGLVLGPLGHVHPHPVRLVHDLA